MQDQLDAVAAFHKAFGVGVAQKTKGKNSQRHIKPATQTDG